MTRGILWFRTDLRLSDNLALRAAMDQCDEIIPVYIFDEKWLGEDEWGFRRTGPYRMKFILECLHDLQEHLRETGSDLVVMRGKPEDILPRLAEKYACGKIFCAKEYTHEEIQVEEKLSGKITVEYFHNSPLIHPDDVVFEIEKMPEVFTTFRKKVEKYAEVREPFFEPEKISSPTLENTDIPKLSGLRFLRI